MKWHVGAIVNEPEAEILRFAAWYASQGAHGITLFFDNPDDPTATLMEQHPNVTVIRCTPDFWQDLGLTPDVRFTKRQNAALNWLYRQTPADWLLNVDADEFMYTAPGSIQALLEGQPEDIEVVRVETAEVVLLKSLSGQKSHYRLPMARTTAQTVYGESLRFFGPKRKGLVGHAAGKAFVRCGNSDLRLRQHWAESISGRAISECIIPAAPNAALLHHIGDKYDVWREKIEWRLSSRGYIASLNQVMTEALNADDCEERFQALYDDLHGCSDERFQRLQVAGVYMSVDKGPDAVAQEVFG
jgi:hypothetical protein